MGQGLGADVLHDLWDLGLRAMRDGDAVAGRVIATAHMILAMRRSRQIEHELERGATPRRRFYMLGERPTMSESTITR